MRICNDKKINKFGFEINQIKDGSGSNAWSKIKHSRVTGVVNFDWNGTERTLTARCIGDDPTAILGEFVCYITARFKRDVSFITIHQ